MSRYTFSIKEFDETNEKLVFEIKEECARKGVAFSFVVLEALKLWQERQNSVKS